ncbi:MAG: hypothetical protein K2X38_01620 [Gemmataceae bacterium]|nr:hypothetical protein [Gemmataceae bacterium]
MVNSSRTPKLYQANPKKRSRDKFFTEHGWHTLDGFLYEADRFARCVEWAKNRYFKTPFTYFVSVNFTQDITPADMKVLWAKVCRALKANGVVAVWTVEASKLRLKGKKSGDRFNYHLILRSETPNVKALLKAATKGVKTNIKPERWNPKKGRHAAAYLVKAKRAKFKDGEKISSDRWASKRVLFKPEHKMRKYGTIGDFWPVGKNKEAIWAEIKDLEKKTAEGMNEPGVEEYADFLQDLTGGFFTYKRVRREVAYWGVPQDWHPEEVVRDNKVISDLEPVSKSEPTSTPPTDDETEALFEAWYAAVFGQPASNPEPTSTPEKPPESPQKPAIDFDGVEAPVGRSRPTAGLLWLPKGFRIEPEANARSP